MVSNPSVITTQPTGSTVCEGQTININITATGNGITYQWYKNGSALADRPGLAGRKGSALVISNAEATDEAAYVCRITNSCHTLTSTGAYITVLPKPVITCRPADMTVCRNNMASFMISTNIPNIDYQWQKNGVDLGDGPNITGTTTRSLQIAKATMADMGFYSCMVFADCDTLGSLPATLTVYDEPVITMDPVSAVICEGISQCSQYQPPAVT